MFLNQVRDEYPNQSSKNTNYTENILTVFLQCSLLLHTVKYIQYSQTGSYRKQSNDMSTIGSYSLIALKDFQVQRLFCSRVI
jgi:hypothetical protein